MRRAHGFWIDILGGRGFLLQQLQDPLGNDRSFAFLKPDSYFGIILGLDHAESMQVGVRMVDLDNIEEMAFPHIHKTTGFMGHPDAHRPHILAVLGIIFFPPEFVGISEIVAVKMLVAVTIGLVLTTRNRDARRPRIIPDAFGHVVGPVDFAVAKINVVVIGNGNLTFGFRCRFGL